MDTQQPSGADHFLWPTSVLRNLMMTGDDIGVLASFFYTSRPRVASALIPVVIEDGNDGSDTALSLVFVSDVDLDKITVEGVRLSSSGSDQFKPVSLSTPLVARRPFSVRLPTISPGLYDLFILAEGGYNVLTAEAVVVVPKQ